MRTLIVDGHSLIVRNIAATAKDDMLAKNYTGGIYASLRYLRTLVSDPQVAPHRVVVCFDNGVPERRKRLLPSYKAARKKANIGIPEEERDKAYAQILTCYDLFGLLGIVCLSYQDREGDDCVAAVVQQIQLRGEEPIVASGDADLLQTVAMGATVHDFSKRRVVNLENFEAQVGVVPQLYLLYRAFVGDPSDSIAGVSGCGAKRTKALLQEALTNHPTLIEETPEAQLTYVSEYLQSLDRPRKTWEEAVLHARARMRDVLKGIDLRASFGPAQGLAARLDAIPEVRELEFLRRCQHLGLRSVLGDSAAYVAPFKKVQKRRAEAAGRS